MTELNPNRTNAPDDPLSHLHKMSTTAGLGTAEYVAVNGMSVVAIIMGLGSSLSLLDPVLLVIPLVALVLSIIAIYQIKHSNGTQTGIGLAVGGLIFALLFCGLVGGRYVAETVGNHQDELAINDVIGQLSQNLLGKIRPGVPAVRRKVQGSRQAAEFHGHLEAFHRGDEGLSGPDGHAIQRPNGVRHRCGFRPEAGLGMTIMDFGQNQARVMFIFFK